MKMVLHFIFLITGLAFLIKGGELFVESSMAIAYRFKIPRMIVGGTLVSLATTIPELCVSMTASWMGDSGIAIGNAVGSVIANIGLIIGISAALTNLKVDLNQFKIRSLWMLISGLLVILFSWTLKIPRFSGFILLFLFIAYLVSDYRSLAKNQREYLEEASSQVFSTSMKKTVLAFTIGAGFVLLGSRLLVTSSVGIATALGIPSIVIGLSIVAVGTSLPELVTAIISFRKGASDLSVGNIVGANVLNLTMITGSACAIRPLTLTHFTQFYSFPWMMLFILAMIMMFLRKGQLGRKGGIMLLSFYSIYLSGLIVFSLSQH